MAKAIKTIKLKIVNPNKGKEDALESTVFILNQVLDSYIDLTLQHRSLLSKKKESVNKKTGEVRFRSLYNSEILTFLEKLSLPTVAHPSTEINIKSLFPGLPTPARRSIINTSTGMCKSYLSNLKNWESHRKGKPPSIPKARNLPTFYKGAYQFQIKPISPLTGGLSPQMTIRALVNSTRPLRSVVNSTRPLRSVVNSQSNPQREGVSQASHAREGVSQASHAVELFDIKNQFVRLKIFDGFSWVWKNYPVKLGRKQLEQLNDPNWSIQSPTLVPKRTKRGLEWYLHIPLVKKVDVKPINSQKKENPNLTTLAVDLGLRHLAVVTVRKNGKIVFVKFFRGEEVEAHRLKHLQKVFRKQQQSGKAVRGERSNKALWRHIRDTNTDVAHNITREIVEIAKKYDVKVIIIEHLHKFQPKRGKKWSRKLNRKLTIRRFVVGELILAQRENRRTVAV